MHLTNSFLSIFINVATQNPKYLVLYDWESKKPEEEKEENKSDQTAESDSKREETETTSKRIKLDHDAFLKKLKQVY